MKRKMILAVIITAIAAFAATSSQAQDKHEKGGDWKKKMMSEKVAFFTVELDLSPEDAQKFWAVYNEIDKEKDEATKAMFKAYFELEKALKENKSEKEISGLLDNYIKAKEQLDEVDMEAHDKIRKVLSVNKTAKLYIVEEEFRKQYIRRLHGGPRGH